MKRTTSSIAAAALILAACGPAEDPAQQYRDALPTAEGVEIGTPESEGTSGALSVRTSALGDSPALQSEYAVMSYYLALTVNSGVGWTLGLVHFVTRFPPTTCDDASCTWGPWVDDDGLNRWKLSVEKTGDAYAWAFSGQPGSAPAAPFVDIVTGTARPSGKGRGEGTFEVDFEAEASLDHGPLWEQRDFGRILVSYDNTADATIGAQFLDGRNDDPAKPHLMNAVYEFRDSSSGGELQVAFEDLETTETVSLRTRWSPSGAGRCDAHYVGLADELWASECWSGEAQAYAEVYDSKNGVGEESACSPFVSAEYADVVLP